MTALPRIALGIALSFSLAACDMPTKPAGADVNGMTNIANQLRAGGDDAGAANFYMRALQRAPNDTQARLALGQILEKHDDSVNAEAQYAEGLQYTPKDVELLRSHGRILLKLGRADEARDAYSSALRVDNDDAKSLSGLGVALDYLGQHEAAQKAYREALNNDPNNLTALNNLAHSYVLAGSYGDAIKLLEPHIHDAGVTPALRQNLAEAYGMAGMNADAERLARMDLPPAQVKRNLDYYKSQRSKLAVAPSLCADLGSFPTQGMAEMHAENVKVHFETENEGLVVAAVTEVKSVGSTPVFSVRVTGFASPARLTSYCESLKDQDYACKPLKGG